MTDYKQAYFRNKELCANEKTLNSALGNFKAIIDNPVCPQTIRMLAFAQLSRFDLPAASELLLKYEQIYRIEENGDDLLLGFCKFITDKQFLLKCMLTMYFLHSRYTFECAKILAKDVRSNLFFRTRGCKMLSSSKEAKHLNSAEKYLTNIGNDISYAENYRYHELSHFQKSDFCDVPLCINRKPLLEALWAFMHSENNTNYYRCIAAEQFLTMGPDEERKTWTIQFLLQVGENQEEEEHTRGNAFDVLVRHAHEAQYQARIRQLRIALGRLGEDVEQIQWGGGIYQDAQSIHATKIAESTRQVLLQLKEKYNAMDREKRLTWEIITAKINREIGLITAKLEEEDDQDKLTRWRIDRPKIYGSLGRIDTDHARFEGNVNLRDALIYLFNYIYYHKEKKDLVQRLFEELVEMNGTCASGHLGRLMNVPNGITNDIDHISIDFHSQINGNIQGRLNAAIQAIDDENLKGDLMAGMITTESDDPDRIIYVDYVVGKLLPKIREELYDEFVGDGYLSKETFENYFEDCISAFK